MTSPHEVAVLNFDLDFLHPTANNIPAHTLLQGSISQVKKRIIRVHALHSHCKAIKLELDNKIKEFDLLKKKLASTTQEYTQTSLEYKEVLENYSKCEKENQILENKFQELQNKYYEAVNDVEAGKSHIVQLQQLVKEQKIELSQKYDTNKTDKEIKESLERELLLCRKTYKKDLTDWQNKYNKLLKELQETKYSKEKLQEQLLAKNDKVNNEIAHDFISHDAHSENDDDIADDCSSEFSNQNSSQNKVDVSQGCPITKKDVMHMAMDNDSKNEVGSVDTGCGSSLASSLNSPDFVFSPINRGSFEINRGHKLVNTGTSPILLVKMTDTATSPPPAVKKMFDVGTSPIKNKNTIHESFGTQTESVETYITSARPICVSKDITNRIVSNTIQAETDTLRDINNLEPMVVENIPHIEIQETQEKQCLELNNSNNMEEDCTINKEVVMILNSMRFNHELITPIPKTPKSAKSVPENVRHTTCQDAAIARAQAATAQHEAAIAREDVAKLGEVIKKNTITMNSLTKQMFYVKNILKNTVTKTLELNDSPMLRDLLKNLTNDDFNDEASNSRDIELDNPVLNKKQIMPVSDSQIEVNLERILGIEPIENSNVTQDENRALLNTLEMETHIDHNISSDIDMVTCLDKNVKLQSELPTKVPKKRGVKKVRKLSYLGKYRKKCELRKFKIRGKTPPLRKPRMKPKPIIRKTLKKTVKKSDTSITLNDKDVYAKAVKVMAELNAKSSKKSEEPVMNARSEQVINTEEDHIDDIQCDQNMSDITSPKSTTISVKPVTVPPEVLPSVVTSPTTDKDMRIPRRSSRSSGLAPSCSPISPIKSPTSAGLSSVLSNLSPTPAITSTLDFKSPIKCNTSTSTTTSTPRATRRSLRLSSNSSIKSLESCTVPTVPTTTASVTTRSQVKCGRGMTDQCTVELYKNANIDNASIAKKRKLSDSSDTQCKRVLRSTRGLNSEEHTTLTDDINQPITSMEIFAQEEETSWNPDESILCVMIKKYAKKTVRPCTRNVPDAVFKSISDKIETFMSKVKEIPCVNHRTMDELVEELHKYDYKNFVCGLIKYLSNPDRKMELFSKSSSPPGPQMTKYEAVMLYVIRQLRSYWRSVDIVDVILTNMEHTLFKLNRTPDFDVIDSVSHFYALVCRYFGRNSRLKIFMLDSMYFILFKSIPLIKQCLEVHPHIIPLAHMSAAKTSLVTIFVYLLHFYKCDDKFNRVQEIRNILVKRYYYQITQWNEKKLLELVENSIMELKDIDNEKKILRVAVIILGKRHGVKWTQNNIIKKLLQIIENDKTIPEHITAFCVSLIGPLMKPYPADMKVHCEIALNKLVNIMNTTSSQRIEEAALSSLIIMARHNYNRLNEILLSKKMKAISPDLEATLRDLIRLRPLNVWKRALPNISMLI